MKQWKRTWVSAVLCASLGAAAAHAAEPGKDNGVQRENKVDLKISAQVNRAVLYGESGGTDETFFVDNDNSSTRLRVVGTGKVDKYLDVGAQIEVEIESNSSGNIRFKQNGAANRTFQERKIEVFLKHEVFGNFWLGQGSMASDGSSEVNLSGTTVVSSANIASFAGGLAFRMEPGGFGPRIGQAFNNFDGLGRDDRVRYDTPTFAGFQASTSVDDDDGYDAALRFARSFDGIKVAAAASHVRARQKTQNFRAQNSGSFSVLFPSGLNATLAYGRRRIANRVDPEFWYASLGWIFDVIDYGPTAVSIDYGRTDDLNAAGDEATVYGAYIVQNITRVGTELYAGIRQHKLRRPMVSLDDVFAAMSGVRVKF